MKTKEIIDKGLSKLLSRKLTVFIISAIALFLETIESGDFMLISIIYMGSQAAEDIFFKYKEKQN